MTESVAAQIPVTEHVGNGVTTSFAYTFTILDSADMVVELGGVVQGSGFTVSGVGVLAGGAVLFTSAPASGVSVLLRRSTDLSRSTAYTYAGDLRETVVDADFNRLWHAMQERAEVEGRSLLAPVGETVSALPAAASRATHLPYFSVTGDLAVTDFTVDQVASAIAAAYVSGTTADAIGWINELEGSQAQSLQTALRRRSVNIFDCLTLAEQLDVLARGHNFDIGAKIQAFSNAVYLRGGGVIEFPDGDYCHSDELWIKQRVLWEGETACFREPYSDPYPAPEGAVLFKLAGSNNNGVLIKCDLTLASGVLYDTGFGTSKRNNGARHGGGIRRMTVWGNRSANPAFTAKDRNNAGSGITAVAARNIFIESCFSMMWADDGFNFGVNDYGTGPIGVNVATLRDNTTMCNSRDGWGGTLGDSRISGGTAGFNGRHGLCMYLGNTTVFGMTSWNNGYGGFYCSGMVESSQGSLVGCFAYDNDGYGFMIDGAGGGRAAMLQSCNSRGNGRNSLGAYSAVADKSNYVVTSTAEHWALLGCASNSYDQGNVLTVACGYYISNWTHPGRFEACADDGLATVYSGPFIAATGNINRPLIGMPGTFMTNSEDVRTSITGNNLDVGYVTEIAFNSASPITINTMSCAGSGRPTISIRNLNAGAVTITHNTANIRCNSGADLVIATYQCYRFKAINSTNSVWQQEG